MSEATHNASTCSATVLRHAQQPSVSFVAPACRGHSLPALGGAPEADG